MKSAKIALVLLALLVPALASAEGSCPAPAATSADALLALLQEAPAPALDLSGDAAPTFLFPPQCDKAWCSENRWGCRQDCLPCGYSFTCYVLDCAYDCHCLC